MLAYWIKRQEIKLFSPSRTYEQLCGCGLCVILHFHWCAVELSLISCSNYCYYFEYVKSCKIMLLLHENPCLFMRSWCLRVFNLMEWNSWSLWWMMLNLCFIFLLWHWVCVSGEIMLLLLCCYYVWVWVIMWKMSFWSDKLEQMIIMLIDDKSKWR